LARRYAAALLDVAIQKNCAEGIAAHLARCVGLMEHGDFSSAVAHPLVPLEGKRKLLAASLGAGDAPALVARLMILLADHKRLPILAEVGKAYREIWNTRRGVLAAEVWSAESLAPKQRTELSKVLERAAGKQVEMATHVDQALLGGVLVRMGGLTVDGTLRRRIQTLRESLTRGPGAH
jgi:F-type H+-transporting ATPase subunit delta